MTARKTPRYINDYEMPKGRYGLAVRAVIDALHQKPGMTSAELLHVAMKKARVTSAVKSLFIPGDKSPVDRLWERKRQQRKDGKYVYRYYLCKGAEILLDTFDEEFEKVCEHIKEQLYITRGLRVNDLVKVYCGRESTKVGIIIDVWAGLSVLVLLDAIPTVVHFERLMPI